MVFGFRRKKSVEASNEPVIRATPSLPELTGQAIAWPEALLDTDELQRSGEDGVKNARKISFSQSQTVPFHRPFRPYASMGASSRSAPGGDFDRENEPTSPYPPTSFSLNRISGVPTMGNRPRSIRRPKLAPTFNLMVVGAVETGKTSFLRLLLETSDVAPTATMDQRADLESFLAHRAKPTKSIQSLSLEILDSPAERLLLTVIDTPGLDFGRGRELVLEQQTNAIVHEIDSRFAETMIEESKVVRSSKGDQHIHLCVYLIDPGAVLASRDTNSNQHTSQEPAPASSSVHTSDTSDSESETGPSSMTEPERLMRFKSQKRSADLSLRPSEIRTLKRLSAKVNVLPIVARIDSMTEAQLEEVKIAVRREIENTGISFGPFSAGWSSSPGGRQEKGRGRNGRKRSSSAHARSGGGNGTGSPTPKGRKKSPAVDMTVAVETDSDSDSHPEPASQNESAEPDSPSSLPVIRIRSTKVPGTLTRARSQSRIRRGHAQTNESDEDFDLARGRAGTENEHEAEGTYADKKINRMSYASMRFYDHTRELLRRDLAGEGEGKAAEREVDRLLPFAIVNPQRRSRKHRRVSSLDEPLDSGFIEDTSLFIRRFKWGTIDVLNPEHCDFVPMRAAIFGSHLKHLKSATKEAYERYRTEKLLVRKARAMYHNVDGHVTLKTPDNHATAGSWVDVAGTKASSNGHGVAQ